jgi:hypothetical protein
MSAYGAALVLPSSRRWIAPTLTEHSDLVMMARALAAAFPVIALAQIGINCSTVPINCH